MPNKLASELSKEIDVATVPLEMSWCEMVLEMDLIAGFQYGVYIHRTADKGKLQLATCKTRATEDGQEAEIDLSVPHSHIFTEKKQFSVYSWSSSSLERIQIPIRK